MTAAEIRADILNRLNQVELTHDVRILLAVESGSRAWGFASPNSDYDVRFIYVKNDKNWYLSVDLEDKRDVIEYPIVDDIDLNGWDVRKALKLFWKSNPTLTEWIQPSIIYKTSGSFLEKINMLLPQIYSCEHGIHHYKSMAKTNYRGYLQAELVPLKKYFYVLRPLLAVRWLEAYKTTAPIEFKKLLHLLEDQPFLLDEINALLEKKKAVQELAKDKPIQALNAFIEVELSRLENNLPEKSVIKGNMSDVNQLFLEILSE
ncbi:MAG: nucleotidyltransferase domain-containing protein [Methylophilaceae bacterium]